MSQYQFTGSSSLFKKVFKLVAAVGILVGVLYAWNTGRIPGRKVHETKVATELENIEGKYTKDTASYNVPKAPLPSGDELGGKIFATVNIYDWHANTALVYGNGGERTLENSLIGQENLVVKLVHQDTTPVSTKAFLDKAVEFKKSGGASGGNLMFTIMKNSTVPLVEPLRADLKEIDPSFRAVGIDLIGKSDGEDQAIVPMEWKTNPDAMRGKTIVGVYDDGDVWLMIRYTAKVGIPINLDCKTFNPNALNVECVDDFLLAGKIFKANHELSPRPVIDDSGRRTGKTTKEMGIAIRPDALASWTPVDYTTVRDLSLTEEGKARLKTLTTITSTGVGDERKVMGCVVIALNKWVDKNVDKLVKLSYATHMAALQLDKYPDALAKAMEINTALLGIWDDGGTPADAAKKRLAAFKGYTAPANKNLHVGGSAVFSFKDAMNMVGMGEGGKDDLANSTYASVYRAGGNLTVERFPEKNIKSFTPFEQFFDPRILRAAYTRAQNEGYGSTELVAERDFSKSSGETLGSGDFHIEFRPGSAKLEGRAFNVLQTIQDTYAGTDYSIEVVGHTDRTGTNEVNTPLSHDRADAVKAELIHRNSKEFGGDRISTDGRGSSEPPRGVDPNYKGNCDTCRRVQIFIKR